ncbi:MAG: ParB/Srx family N-terminal domain-containing protein, partial [Proteobacteria bacterium]|nr:ParB/Srx family N-terminal domain-containing protein [Pseudomonadota bacterium]
DCYLADFSMTGGGEVITVLIENVEPLLERAKNKGIFCDSREPCETAKNRALRILNWLRENKPIEPVKVVPSKNNNFQYKLVDGCHRFHCALAMGFIAVPATIGFDINDLNA